MFLMLFRSIHRNLWRQGSAGFSINVVIPRIVRWVSTSTFSALPEIGRYLASQLFAFAIVLYNIFYVTTRLYSARKHIKNCLQVIHMHTTFALTSPSLNTKQAHDMEFGRYSPVRHTVVCACSTSQPGTVTFAIDVEDDSDRLNVIRHQKFHQCLLALSLHIQLQKMGVEQGRLQCVANPRPGTGQYSRLSDGVEPRPGH
ncbi:hypothetical protein BDW69DRAFT_37603 [Aspergillus filifer]